jgi:hypothetical protein
MMGHTGLQVWVLRPWAGGRSGADAERVSVGSAPQIGATMSSHLTLLASVFPMDSQGRYLHWGVIQISVANLVVIVLMLVVFVVALFAPFPGRKK